MSIFINSRKNPTQNCRQMRTPAAKAESADGNQCQRGGGQNPYPPPGWISGASADARTDAQNRRFLIRKKSQFVGVCDCEMGPTWSRISLSGKTRLSQRRVFIDTGRQPVDTVERFRAPGGNTEPRVIGGAGGRGGGREAYDVQYTTLRLHENDTPDRDAGEDQKLGSVTAARTYRHGHRNGHQETTKREGITARRHSTGCSMRPCDVDVGPVTRRDSCDDGSSGERREPSGRGQNLREERDSTSMHRARKCSPGPLAVYMV